MPWISIGNSEKEPDRLVEDDLHEPGYLTQIATAAKHFYQGSKQIFRAPVFLLQAEHTRDLFWRSAKTNILQYLVPAILYARFVPALRKTEFYELSPDFMEYVLLIPYAIVIASMCRMAQRRKETNLVYLAAYPRVIKKDIEILLPHLAAKEFAHALTEILQKRYSIKQTETLETLHNNLFLFLYDFFIEFFKKTDITAESFDELQKPLTDFLHQQIIQYYFLDNFSNALAEEIVTLFAASFRGLPAGMPRNDSGVEDSVRERLSRAKETILPFLPIIYYPPCSCKEINVIKGTNYNSIEYYRRVNLAELSSIPYSLFNLLFTYLGEILEFGGKISQNEFISLLLLVMFIPSALNFVNIISQRVQSKIELVSLFALGLLYTGHFIPATFILGMEWMGYFARMLLAGQLQHEILVTKKAHCTRHRTEEISRHKWRAFGIGVSQTILAEILAGTVLWGVNVRNICTDAAFFELITQASTIVSHAHNERLPGTGKNTWNLFYLPQQLMRIVLNRLNDKLQKPKSPEEIVMLFAKWGHLLSHYAWATLGPGAIFPSFLSRASKKQVRTFILQHDTLCYFLRLFRQDIEFYLSYVGSAQTLTNWVLKPASSVGPNFLVPFIVILSKVLNDQDLLKLLREIQSKLIIMKVEEDKKTTEQVKIIEDNADGELKVSPALSIPKVAPVLTYQEQPLTPHKKELLEKDLAEALIDNPIFSATEKKSLRMAPMADYFAPPPKIEKPKNKKNRITRDGYDWIEAGDSFPSALQRHSLLKKPFQKPLEEAANSVALPSLKSLKRWFNYR